MRKREFSFRQLTNRAIKDVDGRSTASREVLNLERALDHAAIDAKRGAVDRGGQRAGHERDERSDFLGARESLDQ